MMVSLNLGSYLANTRKMQRTIIHSFLRFNKRYPYLPNSSTNLKGKIFVCKNSLVSFFFLKANLLYVCYTFASKTRIVGSQRTCKDDQVSISRVLQLVQHLPILITNITVTSDYPKLIDFPCPLTRSKGSCAMDDALLFRSSLVIFIYYAIII